jgi:two-component system, NarL family, response regulator DevR
MIKVLVADDFPLVREGMASALGRDPRISVVGFAADGTEALERARELRPNVVVLDVGMPGMSGLVVLTQMTADLPETHVLVVSDDSSDPRAVHAVAAGATGLVSKSIGCEELCEAVHSVDRGEPVLGHDLLAELLTGVRRALGDGRTSMTPRALTVNELEVLRLVAEGRTDAQISESLYISARMVQSHLSRIRAKVGLRRRAQLARWATEHAVS